MVKYRYGEYDTSQIKSVKKWIQKQIFFLLLIVDPTTDDSSLKSVNVNQAFESLLREIGGLNSCLFFPEEIVRITNLLESARLEYNNPDFSTDDFQHCMYRKLILDAGAKVKEIKEV